MNVCAVRGVLRGHQREISFVNLKVKLGCVYVCWDGRRVKKHHIVLTYLHAGPRSAIGRAPDSKVRGPGFDTRPGNILSFLLPLFQEGSCQLLAKVCARSTG